MKRKTIIAALLMMVIMPSGARAARVKPRSDKVDAIVASHAGPGEKIQQLKTRLNGEDWNAAIVAIAELDLDEALKTAGEELAKPEVPLKNKFMLGRMFVTQAIEKQRKTPGLIDVYGPFLVEGVIREGEKQFKQKDPERLNFVGEYVRIMSGIAGWGDGLVAKIADKRVAPVLARCLEESDAPAQDPGGAGEAKMAWIDYRVQRRLIPLALARLGSADAIPALQKALAENPDMMERAYAAYALGVLMEPAESAKLAASLKAHLTERENERVMLGLAKALIERGGESGVELLSFRYTKEPEKPYDIVYAFQTRFNLAATLKAAAVEPLYREALEYPPLDKLLRATPVDEQLRVDYRRLCERAMKDNMIGLAPLFVSLAKESADPQIKQLAQKTAAKLGAE